MPGNVVDYELRLKQLNLESESLQKELSQICEVLNLGAAESSIANDPIINIQSALSELHRSDAAKVVKLTLETHEIASKMSSTIRKRDRDRERVLSLRKKISAIQSTNQNIEKLEADLKSGELQVLCELFSAVLVLSAEDDVREGWSLYYGSQDVSLEGKLSAIRTALLHRLIANVNATEADMSQLPSETIDIRMGEAFNLIPLFHTIDCTEDGLKAVSGIVQKYAAYSLRTISEAPSSLDFRFAVKAGKISDFVRGLLRWCEQRLCSISRANGLTIVASRVFGEAETSLIHIIKTFATERKLAMIMENLKSNDDGRSPTIGELNIKDLDLLAAEMAMIIQNCCLVARERELLAAKNQKYFSELQLLYGSMAELLTSYSKIEIAYLNDGVRMALMMYEVGQQVSTCSEDVFFLVKKSSQRAAAVAEYTVVLGILDCNSIIIKDSFIPFLQKRSRQLFPDPKTGDSVMIAVNDGMSARHYLSDVVDELQRVLEGDESSLFSMDNIRHFDGKFMGGIPNLGKSKITLALNDLEILGNSVDGLVKHGLDAIYSTQIKNKLGVLLTQVCKEISLPENASEGPLRRLIVLVEKTVNPVIATLTEANRISILLMVSAEIASNLERTILSSTWTEELVDCLAPSLRSLTSYLADQTDLEAKNLLQRAMQMVSILDNPTMEDARAMLNDHVITRSPSWRITEHETNTLLQSRSDWS